MDITVKELNCFLEKVQKRERYFEEMEKRKSGTVEDKKKRSLSV